jgi:hypothetical protein
MGYYVEISTQILRMRGDIMLRLKRRFSLREIKEKDLDPDIEDERGFYVKT